MHHTVAYIQGKRHSKAFLADDVYPDTLIAGEVNNVGQKRFSLAGIY